MNRPRVTGFAQSVRDRLRAKAAEQGRPFSEVLELYAVERFLHRLGTSSHRHRFLLKGAQLLRFWLEENTRPTRDVDLSGPVGLDTQDLRDILAEILSLEVADDALDFDLESLQVTPLQREAQVHGSRAKLYAYLGRSRVRFQIDVGFGDTVFPEPEVLKIENLLGLPMASIRAYTPYTSIAEKTRAMIHLGLANTRMKDYYDLMALSEAMRFDGATLTQAIRQSFGEAVGDIPAETPEGLSQEFAEAQQYRWEGFRAKSRLEEAPKDLKAVIGNVARFLAPVLSSISPNGRQPKTWPPGGPWRFVS